MYILYTVLHTYPKAMARRICLTIRSFLSLRFFSLFKGDTVGRNKFDLGTGGGGEGRSRSRGRRRLRYIIIMIDSLPFILCWRRLIPRPLPPKTMLSPRKSSFLWSTVSLRICVEGKKWSDQKENQGLILKATTIQICLTVQKILGNFTEGKVAKH